MLSSISKHKTDEPYRENALDKPCSGVSYSAVGHKFSSNEWAVMIHIERGHLLICIGDQSRKLYSHICSVWWSCGKDGKVT